MRRICSVLLFSLCSIILITPSSTTKFGGGKYCENHLGVYGYCEYKNGVCCDDNSHCCPEGTICDVAGSRCRVVDGESFSLKSLIRHPTDSDSDISPFVQSTSSSQLKSPTICPDRKAACPEDTTCCQMEPNTWGCCELPNAVCCSDNLHCCPHGYRCNVAQAGCIPEGSRNTFLNKIISLFSRMPELRAAYDRNAKAPRMAYETEVCEDKRHECPRGTSCCPTNTGSFACCPMLEAVCCSDGIHCCPKDTVCDLNAGRCNGAPRTINFTRIKLPTSHIPAVVRYTEQLCPDARSRCPDNQTCCLVKDNSWGCCPVPEAVCCNDGKHCCPKGFKCSFDRGMCVMDSNVLPLLPPPRRESASTVCPDPDWQCNNGTTCCPLANEEWGCCSLPNAVCCDDGAHCCPGGYSCDVEHNQCVNKEAISVSLSGIQTKLKHLRCTDRAYRCPEHTRCDEKSGDCIPDTRGEITWFSKIPARRSNALISQSNTEGMIKCPDSSWQCDEDTTCCQLETGTWACCPIPDAVCCSDHSHCCPSGYQCDVEEGLCKLGDELHKVLTASTTVVPHSIKQHVANNTTAILCPGSDLECPSDTTCCQFIGGIWGCCPSKNAVCCSDHMHCCPEGYECALNEAACVLKSSVIPKTAASAQCLPKNMGDTICPDRRSFCMDYQTCCMLLDGDFGCCPLANGSCCADKMHCCPEGTICAEEQGECIRPSRSGLQSVRTSAHRMTPVSQPQHPSALPGMFYRPRLPGQVIRTGWCSECSKDEFCCPNAQGLNNRMCCPIAGSMCCEDGLHCCPPGTHCSGNGQCATITEDRFLAPYLIASKRVPGLVPSVQSRKSLLDPRLLLKYYREFKSVRWTICPDRKRACHLDEQCCPSEKHGYVCAPKTATCCGTAANSYCLSGTHCCADGAFCTAA